MRLEFVVVMFIAFAIWCSDVEAEKMDIEGLKKAAIPLVNTCIRKTGVSKETLRDTAKGIFPSDRQLGCFFKCFSQSMKVMNKEGFHVPANADRQISLLAKDDLAKKIKFASDTCYEQVVHNGDPCMYALEFVICSYKLDPTIYVLPDL